MGPTMMEKSSTVIEIFLANREVKKLETSSLCKVTEVSWSLVYLVPAYSTLTT
jgi:hypothetical protein